MIRKLMADKHTPAHVPGKTGRLYNKTVYWLYERQNPQRAQEYAKNLRSLVEKSDPKAESIFTQECLSLANEAEGDLEQAIKYREREILLIHSLHKLAQDQDAAHADFLFGQYSYADLNDRLYLLAELYRARGNIESAIVTLQQSKYFCEKHGIVFEWESVLQEYMAEQQNLYRTSLSTTAFVPMSVTMGEPRFQNQLLPQNAPVVVSASSTRH